MQRKCSTATDLYKSVPVARCSCELRGIRQSRSGSFPHLVLRELDGESPKNSAESIKFAVVFLQKIPRPDISSATSFGLLKLSAFIDSRKLPERYQQGRQGIGCGGLPIGVGFGCGGGSIGAGPGRGTVPVGLGPNSGGVPGGVDPGGGGVSVAAVRHGLLSVISRAIVIRPNILEFIAFIYCIEFC